VTSWPGDELTCDELTVWRVDRVTSWPCDELTVTHDEEVPGPTLLCSMPSSMWYAVYSARCALCILINCLGRRLNWNRICSTHFITFVMHEIVLFVPFRRTVPFRILYRPSRLLISAVLPCTKESYKMRKWTCIKCESGIMLDENNAKVVRKCL